MKNYIDFDKLEELSAKDAKVKLYQKILKLGEETGEAQAAFLAFDGSKNVSASAGNKLEDLVEETLDVIIVAMDIINVLAKNKEVENLVKTTITRKLQKWENKTNKY